MKLTIKKGLTLLYSLGMVFLFSASTGCTNSPEPLANSSNEEENASDPASRRSSFGNAVDEAMEASEAAQTAQTSDEWRNVAALWSQAIERMKSVPETDENYQVAQQKVTEYQLKLEDAENNAFNAEKVSDFFFEPQRFYGQSFTSLAETLGVSIASSGDRFSFEDEATDFYVETSNGSTITFIQVGVKSLGSCSTSNAIELSEEIMARVGLPSTNWIRVAEYTGYVSYQVGDLFPTTYCPYDGGWYTVGISSVD